MPVPGLAPDPGQRVLHYHVNWVKTHLHNISPDLVDWLVHSRQSQTLNQHQSKSYHRTTIPYNSKMLSKVMSLYFV